MGHVVALLRFRTFGSGAVAYCSSGSGIRVLVMGPYSARVQAQFSERQAITSGGLRLYGAEESRTNLHIGSWRKNGVISNKVRSCQSQVPSGRSSTLME